MYLQLRVVVPCPCLSAMYSQNTPRICGHSQRKTTFIICVLVGVHVFDYGRRHMSKWATPGRSPGHDLQFVVLVVALSVLHMYVSVPSHLHIQRSGPGLELFALGPGLICVHWACVPDPLASVLVFVVNIQGFRIRNI